MAAATIRTPVLFLNVFVVATCGLIYELLAGTLASYLLGDSVTQFSLIIGLYLSALGVGAWVSRWIERDLTRAFLEIELAVALIGGLSAPLLFLTFARSSWFSLVLYLLVSVIGVLVGLELPLLMRILRESLDFRDLVSKVMAVDYIGALIASLLFPLLLVPRLGLVRTSLLFGLLNGLVGFWGSWALRPLIAGAVTRLRLRGAFVLLVLLAAFSQADRLTHWAEEDLFVRPIVYSATTPYQRIVVTAGPAGPQLFLNGNLQFDAGDEYRYHEALVHPALLAAESARNVLVLGGGDGLALRELLKDPRVTSITLVDLDARMTQLSRTLPALVALNDHSFDDSRVAVINEDALIWLERTTNQYDVAIVDFPDPNSFALGKLYTRRFYALLRAHLAPRGVASVQAGSPLTARQSFWCIVRTMEAAGFVVRPYQTAVPSFGVWGFALAAAQPLAPPQHAPAGLRFLNDATLQALFVLPADMGPVPVEINRLDNQALVRYYETEWRALER